MSLCQSSGEEEGWSDDFPPGAPCHCTIHFIDGWGVRPTLHFSKPLLSETDSAELQVTSH